jgi:hypothetical protein
MINILNGVVMKKLALFLLVILPLNLFAGRFGRVLSSLGRGMERHIDWNYLDKINNKKAVLRAIANLRMLKPKARYAVKGLFASIIIADVVRSETKAPKVEFVSQEEEKKVRSELKKLSDKGFLKRDVQQIAKYKNTKSDAGVLSYLTHSTLFLSDHGLRNLNEATLLHESVHINEFHSTLSLTIPYLPVVFLNSMAVSLSIIPILRFGLDKIKERRAERFAAQHVTTASELKREIKLLEGSNRYMEKLALNSFDKRFKRTMHLVDKLECRDLIGRVGAFLTDPHYPSEHTRLKSRGFIDVNLRSY